MKYEKEVRAGIALLDYGQFYGGDWRDKIIWEGLSLHSFSSCVLGQLERRARSRFYRPDDDTITFYLALKRLGLNWEKAQDHGFIVPQRTYGAWWSPVYWVRYGFLTRTWKKLGPVVMFDSLTSEKEKVK
jgi:hypothetical protein